MPEEIESIKAKMDIVTAKNILDMDIYLGALSGKTVALTRCGIGKVNAALCVQILVNMYAVDCVINTGVAGALERKLEIGDVVVSDDVCYHDFDLSAFGDSHKETQAIHSIFAADCELVELAIRAGNDTNANVFRGRIASGDTFVADKQTKDLIRQNLKPLCVDMESAAIGQACIKNKIPFVAIRSVSDKADESAGVTFEKSLSQAARKSAEIAGLMIEYII